MSEFLDWLGGHWIRPVALAACVWGIAWGARGCAHEMTEESKAMRSSRVEIELIRQGVRP